MVNLCDYYKLRKTIIKSDKWIDKLENKQGKIA